MDDDTYQFWMALGSLYPEKLLAGAHPYTLVNEGPATVQDLEDSAEYSAEMDRELCVMDWRVGR